MKIVSINYFTEVVDQEGLRIYKESEAYAKDVEAAKGDWAFAQLQDQVESYYTSYLPVSKSADRPLTEAEVEMARHIIETEHLDGVVA